MHLKLTKVIHFMVCVFYQNFLKKYFRIGNTTYTACTFSWVSSTKLQVQHPDSKSEEVHQVTKDK